MATDALFTQSGRLVRRMARILLARSPGDRIPRSADLARDEAVGHGTVQAAVRLLESLGAATVSAHGAMGSRVESLDYPALWELAGLGPLVCLMPLPYSRRYEGLATALAQLLGEARVPFRLTYLRGALARVEQMLAGHAHCAVTSGLAAQVAQGAELEVEAVHDFGPHSYVSSHVLYVRTAAAQAIARVGVDPLSTDQCELTHAEFAGQSAQFVPLSATQPLAALRAGEVDAVVWNADQSALVADGIATRPLVSPLAAASGHTRAVLLAVGSGPAGRLLRAVLVPERVREIQEAVLSRRQEPVY